MKKLDALIEKQTSAREEARLQSLFLCYSEACMVIGTSNTRSRLSFDCARIPGQYKVQIRVLDIHGDKHTTLFHARHDRTLDSVVSACSAENVTPIVLKKILIQDNNSRSGDIYVRYYQAGRPVAFDVTMFSALQANLFENAALKAVHALGAEEERKYGTHKKYSEEGILCVPLI